MLLMDGSDIIAILEERVSLPNLLKRKRILVEPIFFIR